MTSEDADKFFQIKIHSKDLILEQPIEAQPQEGEPQIELPLPVKDYDYIDDKKILIILMVDLEDSSRFWSKLRNFHFNKENYEIRRPVSIIRIYKNENQEDPMRLFQAAQLILEMSFNQIVHCFKWNSELNLLAIGLDDGQLLGIKLDFSSEAEQSGKDEDFTWNSSIGFNKITDFQPHYKPLTAISIDDAKGRFISISADKTLKKSLIPKGQLHGEIQVDEGKLTCLSVDIKQELAYVGTDNGTIALVNLQERSPYVICKLFVCLDNPVTDILVDSDRCFIFASCKDWSSCVFQYNVSDQVPHKILDYPGRASNKCITWAGNKQDVFVGDSHGNVTVWGMEEIPKYVWKAHKKTIFRVDYVVDHHLLITASKDKTLKVWKLPKFWLPEPWKQFNEMQKGAKEEVVKRLCA